MIQDLHLLEAKPEFSSVGILTIDALAPLSMVVKMPGKYYRSQPAPSDDMLYGMLENALGWHFSEARGALLKRMQKIHGAAPRFSGVGFGSLLQHHVRFTTPHLPAVIHFEDLWAQHLNGPSFVGGSRTYDARAIPLMDAIAGGKVTVNDRAEASKDPKMLTDFQDGDTVHLNVLSSLFPQYYISPTRREYVLPLGPYMYRVETSLAMAQALEQAILAPAAPLYLGSNDGWVDAEWRTME
ncbi:hypothetical protein CCAX7_61870 [Capsulimonas corticalis]|uniref:Uncharacterized protein n=1 Tax=Capsulimonas corticalis TaxID=2219043 RepID=A0A402CWE7_9BACT|nr:hypothetical protein [Capsulimonas corticalis]BDI34136.1 hypothetical protein CCAX7_61870 [Capsulimonas corticalis]